MNNQIHYSLNVLLYLKLKYKCVINVFNYVGLCTCINIIGFNFIILYCSINRVR